jgi:hypothetical protein
MNLIMILLLAIAVLAVAIRIVDSRRTFGFAMLGLVALFLLSAPCVLYLSLDQSRGSIAGATATVSHSRTSAGAFTSLEATASEATPADADDSAAPDDAAAVAEEETTGAAEPGADAKPAVDEATATQPGTLSEDIAVETGEVVIPPRPDWVEAEDVRTGDIHTTAVSSGPHETERECRKALDRELTQAVSRYVDWYLGNMYAERFSASTFVRYELDEIKRRLIPSDKMYHEVIKVSFGPMHQMHAQLAFDQEFRRELDSRRAELDRHWREWIVKGRLLGTGLGFGLLLALMGVFLGYFRLDTATRGFYTGRLQWTAAAAILVLMAAGAVLAGRILQM